MANKDLIDEYKSLGGDKPDDELEKLDDLDLLLEIRRRKGSRVERDQSGVTSVVTPDDPLDLQNVDELLATLDPVDPRTLDDAELDKYLTDRPNSTKGKEEKEMRALVDSRDFLTNVTDPKTAAYVTGRMAAQTGGALIGTADPTTFGPALYGLVGSGVELIPGVDIGAEDALNYSVDRQRKINASLGVGDPRNIEESAAAIAGSLIPLPGPGKLKGVPAVAEAVTPFLIGPTVPKLATNLGVGLAIDQGIRELTDDEDTDYQTVFDKLGAPDATAEQQINSAPIIQAGLSVGLPLVASLPIVAPMTKALWTATKPQTPKIVEINAIDPSGPKNLASIETTADQYLSHIADDKQALINIAKRAGVPDPDGLSLDIDQNTQVSGLMKTNEALNSGKLRGQFGDFNAPVAPRVLYDSFYQLPPEVQREYDLYLKLGDFADDLRLQANNPKGPKGAKRKLSTVQKQRADLRAKYPQLAEFSKAYQGVMDASRDFLQQGPNALIGRNQGQSLAMSRKHFVPSSPTSINPGDPLLTRINQAARNNRAPVDEQAWFGRKDYLGNKAVNDRRHSMETMIEYTRGVLNQQLQNNTRANYVDSLLSSDVQAARIKGKKSPLIRKATADEVRKYPTRIISVVRQGKTTNYITGQLQAQIAQFDPYAVRGVLGSSIVTARRWFEKGTTGVASITFAPTTMIRDTLAGAANVGKGEKGPSILGVLTAPAEILSAKATEAFVRAAEARLLAGKQMIPFMEQGAAQQFVQRAANSLQNTIYTMAKEQGGYDASIMRTRMEVATGAFHEIGRELNERYPWLGRSWGVSAGAAIKGFGALFDSLQEAPRYSAFKRSVKAGIDPAKAAGSARRITGDTNRSGRAFDSRGRLITADAANPTFVPLDAIIGGASEAVRLSVPYFNPSIQGVRRAFGAAADDPVRFALRSWMTVGLPSVVSMAWNNMLSEQNPDGHDYNKYQFEQRSMRDQIMEPIYIGIPGLPPEQGISIPIAHEQVLFAAPYQQMLQHLSSSDEHTKAAADQFGMTLLQNMSPISMPPLANAGLAMLGINPPEIGGNAYNITEDNVGYLPQNVEMTIRELFGAASAYALDAAYAFGEGGPGAAAEEFSEDVLARVPVLKGVAGLKRKATYFTPIAQEQRMKLDAYYKFKDEYDLHYRRGGVVRSTQDFPAGPAGVTMDAPIGYVAPPTTPRPTNPVYAAMGEYIWNSMESNSAYGMGNIRARQGTLTEQINLLKGYNAGRKRDYIEFEQKLDSAVDDYEQAKGETAVAQEAYDAIPRGEKTQTEAGLAAKSALESAKATEWQYEQMIKTRQLLKDNDIDLTDRFDVERLINLLETERHATMEQQLAQIRQIEDDVTDQLVAAGVMPPGRRFDFAKDLAPMAGGPQ